MRSRYLFVWLSFVMLMLVISTATYAQSGQVYLPLIHTEKVHTANGVITFTEELFEEKPIATIDPNTLPPLPEAGITIPITGLSTKGSVIEVGKKSIQLPDDVYVHTYVVEAYCYIGIRCPETPYFVLYLTDDSLWLRVEANEKAYAHENLEQTTTAFSEILSQLGVELAPIVLTEVNQ